jgi:hypothetical protein
MNANVPDDCVVMPRASLAALYGARDDAKKLQQQVAQIQEDMLQLIAVLERDRDEARARCRALDDVETDLWAFAGEVMRSEVPKEIRDKAADLVRKYDTLNPPDLPWLDEPPTSAPENPPDLFAPCYSPPNWTDPAMNPDSE